MIYPPTTQQLSNPSTTLPDDVVLSVRNVSKKFCRNLRRSMAYGIKDLACNLAGTKQDTTRIRKDEFWALKDVSFDLRRGETLGVIGVNGSGKSTLLRVLNGIFPPDVGEVAIRGRIGGLIALGAGMHPHMTGRENIRLNAAILGISKEQISASEEEIIEFAEIGEFIDAPLASYSSGMKVRLGFSVAIHCQPDILLIDEVLAVGDITFVKKATDRMEEMRRRCATIFVSHSMRKIQRVCIRALLLDKGRIEMAGDAEDVVTYYENKNVGASNLDQDMRVLQSIPELSDFRVRFEDGSGVESRTVESGQSLHLALEFVSTRDIPDVLCSLAVEASGGGIATVVNNEADGTVRVKTAGNAIGATLPEILLVPGVYFLKMKLAQRSGGLLVELDLGRVSIVQTPGPRKPNAGTYRERSVWTCENS